MELKFAVSIAPVAAAKRLISLCGKEDAYFARKIIEDWFAGKET